MMECVSEKDGIESGMGDSEQSTPTQQMQSVRIAEGVCRIDAEDMKEHLECTEIILPETLLVLGDGALRCCQTASVHIPKNVTSIGRQAFCLGCCLTVDEENEIFYTDGHALLRREEDGVALQLFFDEEMQEYTVPAEVTRIDEDAFADCYALSALTLPEGMRAFSCAALGHCQLGELKIPASVAEVDGWHRFHVAIAPENPYFEQTEQMVFRLLEGGEKELVRVTGDAEYIEVPGGVVRIGAYAFAYSEVKFAVLPKTVREIGSHAFFASALCTLDLPAEGVVEMGSYAFAQTQLENVQLPATLCKIPKGCFAGSRLMSVSIPCGVAEIGERAFEGTNLTEVFLPQTITALADTAFCGCGQLEEIDLEDSDGSLKSRDGLILDGTKTRVLAWPAARVCKELTLPPSVTDVGLAFSGSTGIGTLRIQGALTRLEKDALHARIDDIVFEQEPQSVQKGAIRPLFASVMQLHVSMHSCLPIALEGKNIEYVYFDADEAFLSAQERFRLGYEDGGYTILGCTDWQERIEIPKFIGDTPVLSIGACAFSEKLYGIYPVEIAIPEGVAELKQAAFFWIADTVRQIEVPASVQVVSDGVFEDESGQYRDMFLHHDLVFYTVAGSAADVFLRAYRRKPGDPRGEELVVISRDPFEEEEPIIEEEPEMIEEEPEAVEEEPEAVEEEPEAVEEEPEAVEEEPEAVEEALEIVEEEPEIIEEEPEVIEEEPEAVEEEPEIVEEEPEIIEEEPEIIEEEPEVIEVEPEIVEEEPEIVEEEPEIVEAEPEIIEVLPVMTEAEPEIIEEIPVMTEAEPEIIEEIPVMIEAEPEIIEEIPVMIEAEPEIIEEISAIVPMIAQEEAPEWKISRKKACVMRYLGKETALVYPLEEDGVALTGIADAKGKHTKSFRRITSVVIPEGYTHIGERAFAGCKRLETVILPDTLREIGKYAFEDCKSLQTVTLPEGVSYVGKGAFKDSGLRRLIVRGRKLTMKKNVLSGCKKACVYAPFGAKVQKVFGERARSILELEE